LWQEKEFGGEGVKGEEERAIKPQEDRE